MAQFGSSTGQPFPSVQLLAAQTSPSLFQQTTSSPDLLYYWSPLVIFLVVLAIVSCLIIICLVLCCLCNFCLYGSICCPCGPGAGDARDPCWFCCPCGPAPGGDPRDPCWCCMPLSASPGMYCCMCCMPPVSSAAQLDMCCCCCPPLLPPPVPVISRRSSVASTYSRAASVRSSRSSVRVVKPRQQIVTFDEPVQSISRNSQPPIIILNQSPRQMVNESPIILQEVTSSRHHPITMVTRPSGNIHCYTLEEQAPLPRQPPPQIATRYHNSYGGGGFNITPLSQHQQQRPRIFVTNDNPTVSCEIVPDLPSREPPREYVLRSVEGSQAEGYSPGDEEDGDIEISDGHGSALAGEGQGGNSFYPSLHSYDE